MNEDKIRKIVREELRSLFAAEPEVKEEDLPLEEFLARNNVFRGDVKFSAYQKWLKKRDREIDEEAVLTAGE